MKKPFFQTLLKYANVDYFIFSNSESRDRNLIIMLAFSIYLSGFLAGYAVYIGSHFLLDNLWGPILLGAAAGAIMILHDQSLLSTDKNLQVFGKLVVSLILACVFTITSSVTKEYPSLVQEMEQEVQSYNAGVALELNGQLDAINDEEQAILQRKEAAAALIKTNAQPLIDARRTLKAFQETKQTRIDRIKEAYALKFRKAQISETQVLIYQTKKLISFSGAGLITLLLAFFYFLFEAMPVILRLLLSNSQYLKKYFANINLQRSLSEQNIEVKLDFVEAESDGLPILYEIDLLDHKQRLIECDFRDQLLLEQYKFKVKMIKQGLDPYSGKPINEIIIPSESGSSSTEEKPNNDKNPGTNPPDDDGSEQDDGEEPLFTF